MNEEIEMKRKRKKRKKEKVKIYPGQNSKKHYKIDLNLYCIFKLI